MSQTVLKLLESDEYLLAGSCHSTPGALRRALSRTEAVRQISKALNQGTLTERAIRRWLSARMSDLQVGERFPHDLALTGLAVAMESWHSEFADEFLQDLAGLQLAEMSTSIRMAKEVLKRREQAMRDCTRTSKKRASA